MSLPAALSSPVLLPVAVLKTEPEQALVEALNGLDRLLQHRLRLTVCALLARHDAMSFKRLKDLTGETDGNLGANMTRLEEAGYLKSKKDFVDRRPVTWYRLSPAGRKALRSHLAGLEHLLRE